MTAEGLSENQQPAEPAGDLSRGAFVGLLTGRGRGAIAVLRVWGPRALEVVDAVFRSHRGARLAEARRGELRLGRIGHGLGDEVVAFVLEGDPPAVEIQCHGGAAAIALIFETLQAAGATTAEPAPFAATFADNPFADGALADLARAPTLRTAEILLDQAQGALGDELVRLSHCINLEPGRALADLEALIRRGQVGLRLLCGWSVAIAGRPNVGKSRLFNALVGFARAIVDPTPGTTRDVVSKKVSFGGWPVELADTAGLREARDPVEKIGIERSRREQRAADLIILVLDRSRPLQPIDHELIANNPRAIMVANKCDLPPAWQAGEPGLRSRTIALVSAERGDGLEGLIDTIVRRLVPDPLPPGAAVPFRADQMDRLGRIRDSLLSGNRQAGASELALVIAAPKRGV